MNNFDEDVAKWMSLNSTGKFDEAKVFYFETLFSSVLNKFEDKYKRVVGKTDVLFSILGFTPEPILLTQCALKPQVHIIFYSDKGEDNDDEINKYLERFSSVEFQLIELSSESFDVIYETLKEQMLMHPATSYSIDITGGKKSMVASAAIFGRDYNFNVLYVDFDKYDPNLRRPVPGSEILNVVYSPIKNLPEIFHSNINNTLVREVKEDVLNKYKRDKSLKLVTIKDINLWGFYGFDTAREVLKCGDTYTGVWKNR